ncbi:MAG: hypothetical protein M1814_005488 [Vezdaea aestivalis]|nr:MAG: hypothetical protein M1814_005488 [Vezdaea aestivalis]
MADLVLKSPKDPGSPESYSTPQLTPRSKVKALLASFSDDSDDATPNKSQWQDQPRISAPTAQSGKGSVSPLDTHREGAVGATEAPDKQSVYERVKLQLMAVPAKNGLPEIIVPSSPPPCESEAREASLPTNDKDDISSGSDDLNLRWKEVARERPAKPTVDTSGDDVPENPAKNKRFLALIERRRDEQRMKDVEETEKRAAKKKQHREVEVAILGMESEADDDSEDDRNGSRLTQQARPTRKASRKAVEDMQRETQRMARNMQLAHEARTTKKITTASFLARFNYGNGAAKPSAQAAENPSSSTVASDIEEAHSTAPTSPSSALVYPREKAKPESIDPLQTDEQRLVDSDTDNKELPTIRDILSGNPYTKPQFSKKPNLGDAIISRATATVAPPLKMGPLFKGKGTSKSLLPSREAMFVNRVELDSDDDIEILPKGVEQKKTIWDQAVKEEVIESKDLLTLRALAHLTSPSRRRVKKGKTLDLSELQFGLQRRARQQAVQERNARLQELRDKGIIIQTSEERAKEIADVEDLVAKARKEAQNIKKKESVKAKSAGGNHDENSLSEDSEEDEDWTEEHVKASGGDDDSEDGDDEIDEEEDESEGDVDETGNSNNNKSMTMVDLEASEDSDDEDGDRHELEELGFVGDEEEVDQGTDQEANHVNDRRKRVKAILDSDDEGPVAPNLIALKTPSKITTPRSAQKIVIPGLPQANDISMGLTQIFAGTMDDSQSQNFGIDPLTESIDPNQDSIAFLRQVPGPSLPSYDDTLGGVNIPDSQQPGMDTQAQQDSYIPDIYIPYPQPHVTPMRVQDSFTFQNSPSQNVEIPDPTQDKGFGKSSPIADRFDLPPGSTIDTLIVSEKTESPLKRRRRLQRRKAVPEFSDDELDKESDLESVTRKSRNANRVFDEMRRASKVQSKRETDFNKKESNAKKMVDEQAEESEDEYAGLGGASDDDSGLEDADFNRDMVDDEGPDGNERELAAFYADKERAKDEKDVERLFNDISKGILRKKRGAEYSLSDSDDDGEARRRRKRREFAKMRKALLADNEEVGKIAHDPKKQAFLLAIEDRDPDDELDFLDEEEIPTIVENGESQVDQPTQEGGLPKEVVDAPIPSIADTRKRKREDQAQETRLPPHLRRTNGNRSSGLAHIRETLSFLGVKASEAASGPANQGDSSDVEQEGDGISPDDPEELHIDGTPCSSHQPQVIDRLSLLRQSSSSSSSNPTTPLAFATASTSSNPLFKVPSLLRRATTSSIDSIGVTYGDKDRSKGGKPDTVTTTKSSGKGGSVNVLRREKSRNTVLEASEKKHADSVKKRVQERRGVLKRLTGNRR